MDDRVVPRSTDENGVSKVQGVFRDMRKYCSEEFERKCMIGIRELRRTRDSSCSSQPSGCLWDWVGQDIEPRPRKGTDPHHRFLLYPTLSFARILVRSRKQAPFFVQFILYHGTLDPENYYIFQEFCEDVRKYY